MIAFIPRNLKKLSATCDFPIYVVGGSVRDFLSGHARVQSDFSDWDICAPVSVERFSVAAKKCGFIIDSEYKNTGTLKLSDSDGTGYEFSSFRSDKYVRGNHTPSEVYFTEDISLDARRRDFTCNAVYFNVKTAVFCDPLGGMEDIRKKVVRTVRESRKVFGEDGLRLMRLARQCGQLGFSPSSETFAGAQEHAALILDISPERIFAELNAILYADLRYHRKEGAYRALKILDETGVLNYILPELTSGRGMAQPVAFHNYDVLEHSLRCVYYATPAVRWAALLHDVGKPFCFLRDGNYYLHPEEGARIADEILTRLKSPKSLKEHTRALILQHMYDIQNVTRERKLRRYFVEHNAILTDLLALKQADFSACKDDVSPCPAKSRWESILTRMREEGVPFQTKDLKINGKDLLDAGMPAPYIGKILHELLMRCANEPQNNRKEMLLEMSHGVYRSFLAKNR